MHWALLVFIACIVTDTHTIARGHAQGFITLGSHLPPAYLSTAKGEMHQKNHSFGFFLARFSGDGSSSAGWWSEPWTSHASWLPAPT